MNHGRALTTPAQNMQHPAFSTTVPLAQTHPISWDTLGTCGDCRARVRAQPDPALSRALRPMGRVRPKAPGLRWLFLSQLQVGQHVRDRAAWPTIHSLRAVPYQWELDVSHIQEGQARSLLRNPAGSAGGFLLAPGWRVSAVTKSQHWAVWAKPDLLSETQTSPHLLCFFCGGDQWKHLHQLGWKAFAKWKTEKLKPSFPDHLVTSTVGG